MRKVLITLLALAAALTLGLGPAYGAQNNCPDTLAKIKERGYMIAGVKDAVVPFGYVDEETNDIVGFDVDICKYIADKLGVELRLKPVTSSTRIPMLAQGSVDMLAATMTHKFSRDETIDFSITYFMTGQKILVEKGSGVDSVDDLAGKKVGTAKGSTSEKNIKQAQPECKVLSFEGYPQAFLALRQGKVSAVTTDATILLGLKNSAPNPDKWIIAGEFISDEPYGLGVPENDSDFRDFVNKALADMWKSGKYKEIYNKWFGPDTKYHLPLDWEMTTWPY
jgi:polar amino acid transport system substrate-binding protein